MRLKKVGTCQAHDPVTLNASKAGFPGRPLMDLRSPPDSTDDYTINSVKIAPLPPNETERLQAVRRYNVLDTGSEEAFDDLTRLAARICGTPVSLITLLDESRR